MGSSVLRSGWSGSCCWDMDSASESCSELEMYSGSGQYSGLKETSESSDWFDLCCYSVLCCWEICSGPLPRCRTRATQTT